MMLGKQTYNHPYLPTRLIDQAKHESIPAEAKKYSVVSMSQINAEKWFA